MIHIGIILLCKLIAVTVFKSIAYLNFLNFIATSNFVQKRVEGFLHGELD